MNRTLRRAAMVLPVLLVALGSGTSAQASGSWSAPVALPAGVGSGAFAENASGAQIAVTGTGPQISRSADGQTWSAPVAVGQGGTGAAVALAPDGRAVAAWVGGTSAAPVIQASTQPSGGAWSSPVTVAGDGRAPLIGVDASGDAIIAWEGSTGTVATGPVYTASLPAGGGWTPRTTLATAGGNVRLAVNDAGAAIVAWGQEARAAWVASGTILGGFAAPVNVGPSSYGHTLGNPYVALNAAGQAVLTWGSAGTNATAATRTPAGTWSPLAFPGCAFPFSTAIDGAGDAIVTCEVGTLNAQGQWVTTYVVSRLVAGGAWGAPTTLTGDFLTGRFASVADAAGTFVIAVNDTTARAITAYTSPPGGDFGAAVPLLNAPVDVVALNVVAGRATLVWNTTAGAFESTESVS